MGNFCLGVSMTDEVTRRRMGIVVLGETCWTFSEFCGVVNKGFTQHWRLVREAKDKKTSYLPRAVL